MHVFKFSRGWYRLHVFPRLVPVARFPALGTGCTFSRAWHWFHVFPRLAPVAYFPAVGTGCRFSYAWYWLQVIAASNIGHIFPYVALSKLPLQSAPLQNFLRLTLVRHRFVFSRAKSYSHIHRTWRGLNVYARFAQVVGLNMLGSGCVVRIKTWVLIGSFPYKPRSTKYTSITATKQSVTSVHRSNIVFLTSIVAGKEKGRC